MEMMLKTYPRAWVCALGIAALAFHGHTMAEIKISPSFFSNYTYLSNVFKFENDQQATTYLGQQKMGDSVTLLGASLSSEFNYKNQTALLDLGWKNSKFTQFDFLDNTSKEINARWQGKIASLWAFRFGAQYHKKLSDFGEKITNITTKNEQQNKQYTFGLTKQLRTNWFYLADVKLNQVDYTHPYYTHANRDETIAELAVQYKKSPDKYYSAFINRRNTEFVDRIISDTSKVDDQTVYYNMGVTGYWSFSGNSSIDIRSTLRQIRHPNFSERNFIKPTAVVAFNWFLSSKNTIVARYRYEVAAVDYVLANYANINEYKISYRWSPKHNLTFDAGVLRNYYSYEAEGDSRSDEKNSTTLSAQYAPVENFVLSVSMQRELRDSTLSGYNYDANSLNLLLNFRL